jgi:hypothetical protein
MHDGLDTEIVFRSLWVYFVYEPIADSGIKHSWCTSHP